MFPAIADAFKPAFYESTACTVPQSFGVSIPSS